MLRTTTRTSLLFLLSITVGLLVLSAPATACMSSSGCNSSSCPPGCSCSSSFWGINCDCGEGEIDLLAGPRTTVQFLDATTVRLTVQGYDTTQLNPTTSCVTAFPPLGTVASVDSVVNYDGRDDQPFEEVSFYRSELPDSAVAEFAQELGVTTSDAPWYAFQSHIIGTVEDGVSNYFVVELTLNEGVSPLAFMNELKLAGQFLTSGSDEAGTPDHHPFFRQIGDGPITAFRSIAVTPHGPHTPSQPVDR